MWAIERMRRRAGPDAIPREVALALVAHGRHGLEIAAANEAARAQGVRPGASLADTRAAHPALLTRPAEPEASRGDLLRLARWCGRYGPARHADGEDGLWIDVTGVAHLFRPRSGTASPGGDDAGPDERALAADLVARLAGFGLTARVGLADTLGAAHALARYATSPAAPAAIAPGGEARAALAPLPVSALRIDTDAVRLLERLGLRRIGQLYGLPRPAIERRFRSIGAKARATANAAHAAAVVLRLDQALGEIAEPRRPLEAPPDFACREAFAEPLVTAGGIEAVVDHLSTRLAALLAERGVGGRRFGLSLYRVDGTIAQVRIGTRAPCQDAGHIRRLLAEKAAGLDAGFGIDVAVLAAAAVEPHVATQPALAGRARDAPLAAPGDPDALIDRLSNRLGADRVLRLEPCASHIPERAQRLVPALTAPTPHRPEPTAATAPAGRPALLFARPEPIEVLAAVPEGAPALITWRHVRRRIVHAQGPERIAPEWWRALRPPAIPDAAAPPAPPPPPTRDYYVVEEESGARYWVFRAGLYESDEEDDDDRPGGPAAPRWFLHGIFP